MNSNQSEMTGLSGERQVWEQLAEGSQVIVKFD